MIDHAGLELAQVLSQIPKGDFPTLMDIMRSHATEMRMLLDTDEHKGMLTGVEIVEIQDFNLRQQFFRELFMICVSNVENV